MRIIIVLMRQARGNDADLLRILITAADASEFHLQKDALMAVREVKLCLVGEASVGKTCITSRFVHDHFSPVEFATIGASFVVATTDARGRSFRLHIWDTAGGEKYRALGSLYYRDAEAAVVVYDITRKDSFKLLQSWIDELQERGPANIVLTIAGNKCDLSEQREVPYAEACAYAESVGADFFEVSAKCDVNIRDLFATLCERLPDESPAYEQYQRSFSIAKDETKGSNCC